MEEQVPFGLFENITFYDILHARGCPPEWKERYTVAHLQNRRDLTDYVQLVTVPERLVIVLYLTVYLLAVMLRLSLGAKLFLLLLLLLCSCEVDQCTPKRVVPFLQFSRMTGFCFITCSTN